MPMEYALVEGVAQRLAIVDHLLLLADLRSDRCASGHRNGFVAGFACKLAMTHVHIECQYE